MDFIAATIGRLRRSPEMDSEGKGKEKGRQRGAANTERGARGRGERKRGRGRGGGRGGKGNRDELIKGQGRGCLLKEIHLNVTDLGLGYQTKEELIFRYCSGPCYDSETNYDKILNNLTQNKKLDKESPSQTCCRPIAFDDDLSFLDDSLEYHTLKKHSAKKCACVWFVRLDKRKDTWTKYRSLALQRARSQCRDKCCFSEEKCRSRVCHCLFCTEVHE